MKRLKDLCLGVLLNEGENVFSLSPSEVGSVLDVNIIDDDIKIKFETSYGKTMDLVVKSEDLRNWASSHSVKDIFRHFVIDFISNSNEGNSGLNEIIDDNGDIMGDDDMPSNSTNSLVVGPKFDLEKIYRSFIPKSIRFYSGDLGIGIITW
ncbi:MAG: hypothetical protein AABY15_08965 [Nanoarchaeota archaeon]